MTELSLVDASGVRQTRVARSNPKPTGASEGQPTVRSVDFKREIPVDTELQPSVLAGAFAAGASFFGKEFDRQIEKEKADSVLKRKANFHRNVARIQAKMNEDPQKAGDAIRNRNFDFLLGPDVEFNPDILEDAAQALLGEKFANLALDNEFKAGLESLPDGASVDEFTENFIIENTEGAHPLFAASFGNRLLSGSSQTRTLIQQTRRNKAQLESLDLGITAYERRLAEENWVVGETSSKTQLEQIIAALPNQNIPAVTAASMAFAKSTFRGMAAGNKNAIEMANQPMADGRTMAEQYPDDYNLALKQHHAGLEKTHAKAAKSAIGNLSTAMAERRTGRGELFPMAVYANQIDAIVREFGASSETKSLWNQYREMSGSNVLLVASLKRFKDGEGIRDLDAQSLKEAVLSAYDPTGDENVDAHGLAVLFIHGGDNVRNSINIRNAISTNEDGTPNMRWLGLMVEATRQFPKASEKWYSNKNDQALHDFIVGAVLSAGPGGAKDAYDRIIAAVNSTPPARGPILGSYVKNVLGEPELDTDEKKHQQASKFVGELYDRTVRTQFPDLNIEWAIDQSPPAWDELSPDIQGYFIRKADITANLFGGAVQISGEEFDAQFAAVSGGRLTQEYVRIDGDLRSVLAIDRSPATIMKADGTLAPTPRATAKTFDDFRQHVNTDRGARILMKQLSGVEGEAGISAVRADSITGFDGSLNIQGSVGGFASDVSFIAGDGWYIPNTPENRAERREGLLAVLDVDYSDPKRILIKVPEPKNRKLRQVLKMSEFTGLMWVPEQRAWRPRYFPGVTKPENDRADVDAHRRAVVQSAMPRPADPLDDIDANQIFGLDTGPVAAPKSAGEAVLEGFDNITPEPFKEQGPAERRSRTFNIEQGKRQ